MANMSYCRMHNTKIDLEDVIESVDSEYEDYPISDEEARALRVMIGDMYQFLYDNEIIDYDCELNKEAVDDLINRLLHKDVESSEEEDDDIQ